MWTTFKVFIEFVTILLLFYVLVFWPCGMWNLRILVPLQGVRPTCPCIGRQSLNHKTAREVPLLKSEIFISTLLCLVAQSCLTLCNPVDCSLPGSSVHGISQARILEWGAISFSRGSSRPRDETQVSRIIGRRFTVWATRETSAHYQRVNNNADLGWAWWYQ